MSILPEGWAYISLGELGKWGSGGTPKRTNPQFYEDGTIPWLVIGDLNDDVVTHAATKITQKGIDNSSTKLLPLNTLLVGMYGSIGKLGITGIECATNQAIAFCIPDKRLVSLKYMFYVLMHSKTHLIKEGKGGAQQNISQTVIKGFDVPIAPLNEQEHIVEKLERLLARVDNVQEKLNDIPKFITNFRRTILSAATSGQLSKEWRSEIYGKDVLHSLNNWKQALIGDLFESKPRNGYSPKSVDFETPTKSMTLSATTSGKFKSQYVKYLDEEIAEDSFLWLKPNDILIQRANTLEYVGVSAIYDGLANTFIYPDLMMKCRANEEVLTKYLYYLLSSDKVRTFYRENATGTAGNMPKINQKTVVSAPVSIPPLDEQKEIVRRVEHFFALLDRIESRYLEAQIQVDKLTASILSKAFRGELIPQDPNDEPANILLERIAS